MCSTIGIRKNPALHHTLQAELRDMEREFGLSADSSIAVEDPEGEEWSRVVKSAETRARASGMGVPDLNLSRVSAETARWVETKRSARKSRVDGYLKQISRR